MIFTETEHLEHYGVARKSGRYPWGSGDEDHPIPQRSRTFLDNVQDLRNKGLTDSKIAEAMGLKSTTELRAKKTIAINAVKRDNIDSAQRLKDKGLSNTEIGKRMNIPEPSVRNLLKPGAKDRADNLLAISDMLKKEIDSKTFVDVGKGVPNQLKISKEKLETALTILKEEDYRVHNVQAPTGPLTKTTIRVLTPPGTTYTDVVTNLDKIHQINQKSEDGGRSFLGLLPPIQIDSGRISVKYKEDGGADADGVIFVRPGVHDLSLGKGRYAQVRIAVDGTHYLKGMAMYKDDLPSKVDIVFNTNKSDTGNKLDAMKPLERDLDGNIDKDNPFGSVVDQIKLRDAAGNIVLDANGKERVTSAMNLVNEEGDWNKWSKTLSSQMLSKQSPRLAGEQLAMSYEKRVLDYNNIMGMTNPVVRKTLLLTFADSADSASVHLKAAHMPRQRSQVILPVHSLKPNEVYAPNFLPGERVVLVRYPHGGPFEIPELIVNNRNREAKSSIGQAIDAIGINSKVAARLSGADFDGDTVLVIPNDGGRIRTAPALLGLRNFDPVKAYPKYEGMPDLKKNRKDTLMGEVSNLITDMTLHGATNDEMARAVRHSMVVIDAAKHKLNYKQSAIDNGILDLKKRYQGGSRGGASTLISLARSRVDLDARKPRPAREKGPIDRETGRKVFVPKGEAFVNPKGVLVRPQQTFKRLEVTDDAHTLSSGTPMEALYANHSNKLKALANDARKTAIRIPNSKQQASAKTAYPDEVASLKAKLNLAEENAPRERQARLIANANVAARRAANPNMERSEIKKLEYLALREARNRTNAGKERIHLTDSEWKAIQAGAVSHTTLTDILRHADLDRVTDLALPRRSATMSSAQSQRAQSMLNLGYTQAEVANHVGVSIDVLLSTLQGGKP